MPWYILCDGLMVNIVLHVLPLSIADNGPRWRALCHQTSHSKVIILKPNIYRIHLSSSFCTIFWSRNNKSLFPQGRCGWGDSVFQLQHSVKLLSPDLNVWAEIIKTWIFLAESPAHLFIKKKNTQQQFQETPCAICIIIHLVIFLFPPFLVKCIF